MCETSEWIDRTNGCACVFRMKVGPSAFLFNHLRQFSLNSLEMKIDESIIKSCCRQNVLDLLMSHWYYFSLTLYFGWIIRINSQPDDIIQSFPRTEDNFIYESLDFDEFQAFKMNNAKLSSHRITHLKKLSNLMNDQHKIVHTFEHIKDERWA